eukprot:gene10463-2985_t
MEEDKKSDEYTGFDENVSLEMLRKEMVKFSDDRDWNQYHQPRNLLLAMVGEVGELSEIFQWKGECKIGLEDWNEKEKEHLGEELSDVLLYLINLSHRCNINLSEAVLKKIQKNELKYPIEKSKSSLKKYTEL